MVCGRDLNMVGRPLPHDAVLRSCYRALVMQRRGLVVFQVGAGEVSWGSRTVGLRILNQWGRGGAILTLIGEVYVNGSADGAYESDSRRRRL